MFSATDTTDKCINITTNEDSFFEANEMFTVSLSVISPTTGVTIQRSQTTVVIVDDDGIIVVLHVVLMSACMYIHITVNEISKKLSLSG